MAFPTGWNRCCALTIGAAVVSGTPGALHMLVGYKTAGSRVDLPDECMLSGGANAANSDGGDIRFTSDAAGTLPLPADVTSFAQADPVSGASAEIWVKLTPANNSVVYIWYHNSSATMPAANDATWGWNAVWSHCAASYPCNDVTTSTIADRSANANTGTKRAANEPPEAAGAIGRAQDFLEADSDYIDITPSASLNITGAISIEFWVKPANVNENYTRLLHKADTSGAVPGYGITQSETDGKLVAFYQEQYMTKEYGTLGSEVLVNGTWYHVVMTWDGTTKSDAGVKIYVNGVEKSSARGANDKGWSAGAGSDMRIGSNSLASSCYYNGVLDAIHILPSALTLDQIVTLYNNQNSATAFWARGTPFTPVTSSRRRRLLCAA